MFPTSKRQINVSKEWFTDLNHGKELLIFELILTTFDASPIFEAAWAVMKISLSLKSNQANLACRNMWNTLYVTNMFHAKMLSHTLNESFLLSMFFKHSSHYFWRILFLLCFCFKLELILAAVTTVSKNSTYLKSFKKKC